MAKRKDEVQCDRPECKELRKEFGKIEQRLLKMAEESGDPGTQNLTKRVIRSMHDVVSLVEGIIAAAPVGVGVPPQSLKDLFDDFHLTDYGYTWDTHISPLDNLIMVFEQGVEEMIWHRKYLYRLRAAVVTGDTDLIVDVAKESLRFPENALTQQEKEDALAGINVDHPRGMPRILETEERSRLCAMYDKYRLGELGFPWDDDLSAVDNAILVIREGAVRLIGRWCYLMEMAFAVENGDESKILEKAREITNIQPPLRATKELYDEYCEIRELIEGSPAIVYRKGGIRIP